MSNGIDLYRKIVAQLPTAIEQPLTGAKVTFTVMTRYADNSTVWEIYVVQKQTG